MFLRDVGTHVHNVRIQKSNIDLLLALFLDSPFNIIAKLKSILASMKCYTTGLRGCVCFVGGGGVGVG
jgi:hypothetical protein